MGVCIPPTLYNNQTNIHIISSGHSRPFFVYVEHFFFISFYFTFSYVYFFSRFDLYYNFRSYFSFSFSFSFPLLSRDIEKEE